MLMIDRYLKVLLTIFALIVLTLPVKAEEKQTVWFCSMTAFNETTSGGSRELPLEKFKFKINTKEIQFGTGGYMDGVRLKLTPIHTQMYLAEDLGLNIIFANKQMHVAQVAETHTVAFSAQCDDF